MNGDGQMDINEFSIACKLITMKLKNVELPTTLPPILMAGMEIKSFFKLLACDPHARTSHTFFRTSAGLQSCEIVQGLLDLDGRNSQKYLYQT